MSKRVRFSTEDNTVHVLPDTQRTSTKEQDEQVEQLAGDYKRLKTGSDHTADMDSDAVVAARMSRRQRADKLQDDTEEVDILAAEEETPAFAEDEEEQEVPLEPFNMRKEREEGILDDEGNYLDRRKEKKKPVGGFNEKGDYVILNDEEEEEADGWLDSLGDVKVDKALATKLAAKAAKDEASYRDEILDDDDKVVFKKRIASLLKPEETVLSALRRLGGTQQSRGREARNTKRKNRHKKDLEDAQAGASGAGHSSVSAEDKAAFNKLTELADALLSNGEFNIYSFTREGLLESVGVSSTWGREEEAPQPSTAAPEAGAKESIADIFKGANIGQGQQTGAAAAADDDDDDMFGSDDEAAGAKPAAAQPSSGGAPAEGAKAAPGEPSSSAASSATTGAAGAGDGNPAMEGFQYDEGSGYYYNSELGYWYDASSGLYGDAATGLWYSYSDGQYHLVDSTAETPAAAATT